MNRSLDLALLLTLSCAFASSTAAQTSPGVRRGMASSLASGMSLHPRTGADLVHVKAPLDQTSTPPAFLASSYQGQSNYELGALFPGFESVIEIDACSSGNDMIPPLTEGGMPDLSLRQSWMAVTISVTNETLGLPGSLIEQRRHRPAPQRTTPGADLIGYYYQDSTGIDPRLLGATVLEQESEQVRLANEEDVDGFDWGIGVNTHARGTSSGLFFIYTDWFFFSVSNDCVDALNAGYPLNPFAEDSEQNALLVDGASVYFVSRAGAAWSKPVLYREAGDMGLVAGTDELDALAVSDGTGVVVFSTQPKAGRSQLRVHQAGDQQAYDLRELDGSLVATKAGVKSNDDTDDIDAVCIIDPDPDERGTHMGIATGTDFGVTNPMGISMTRHRPTPTSLDEVLIQITGWGGLQPQKGTLFFYIAADYNPKPGAPPANWVPFASMERLAAQDSIHHQIQIQPGVYGDNFSITTIFLSDTMAVTASMVTCFNVH